MARRPTAKRSRLLDELMLEARRTGSLGALHSRPRRRLAGVNATDWECLDVLDWTGPITAGELARRVGITSGPSPARSTGSSALGLVRRRADPNDRRKVIVELAAQRPVGVVGADSHQLTECFEALVEEIAGDQRASSTTTSSTRDPRLAARRATTALERSIDGCACAATRGAAGELPLLLAQEALDLGGELVAGTQLEPFVVVEATARLIVVVDPLQPRDHLTVLVVALDELVEALALQDHLATQRREPGSAIPVTSSRASSRATDAAG